MDIQFRSFFITADPDGHAAPMYIFDNAYRNLGISYTFGSIYNNIVNSRFSGGQTMFFF